MPPRPFLLDLYGENTKFTIKRFPSKPGGHFLEAGRALFCPRAADVRNPALGKLGEQLAKLGEQLTWQI